MFHKAHLVDVSSTHSTNGKMEIFGNLNTGYMVLTRASEEIREGDIIH